MTKEPVQFVCIILILINWSLTNAELFNIALNKPTFQSGTLEYPDANHRWLSEHAVDGNKNCPFPADSRNYSATDNLITPWWQVDLGRIFTIEKVVVYGRPQEKPSQLKGFRLYITRENLTISSDLTYENTGYYGNGIFSININASHQQGRYLTIVLPQTNYSERAQAGPLVLCEVEIFTQVSDVAKVADISVSSTLQYNNYNYNKDNVIDNRTSTENIDNCGCCWVSASETNPKIQFILPSAAQLVEIVVVGRTDSSNTAVSNQLTGIEVIIDGILVQPTNIKTNLSTNTVTIEPPLVPSSNITISRPKLDNSGDWHLIICEVFMYKEECIDGYFGENCSSQCNCLDKRPCDRTMGTCVAPFCKLGWMGLSCNIMYSHGWFGEGCNEQCFCADGDVCSHDYGICPGKCMQGYQGPQCNLKCSARTFGAGCLSECHCLKGSNCHYINGTCERGSCDPGWTGPACDMECPSRTFGLDCKEICHCKECNHISGLCDETICEPGWNGSSCSQVITKQAVETSSRSITIGASVGAAVVIALVASLVVFVTYRRRAKAKDKPDDVYTQPDFNLSTNTGDYDTLETSQSQGNNGDATHRVSSM